MAVSRELELLGIRHLKIDLGVAETAGDITSAKMALLKQRLQVWGLEIIIDRKTVIVEKVKNVVTEMIHYDNDLPKCNYSIHISKRVGYDYTYLANTFSEVKGVTIQQFIISHKIELVKELLFYGELNLTEIADKLNYSSVAHLCNQFKKATGFTPSFYNSLEDKARKNLENL